MNAPLSEQIAKAQAELADIKRDLANYVMVPRAEWEKQRALYFNEAADELASKLPSQEPADLTVRERGFLTAISTLRQIAAQQAAGDR